VIRGNVVLNTLSARSISTLLRDQIYIEPAIVWQRTLDASVETMLKFSTLTIKKKFEKKYVPS
jgi:hypothetical protein